MRSKKWMKLLCLWLNSFARFFPSSDFVSVRWLKGTGRQRIKAGFKGQQAGTKRSQQPTWSGRYTRQNGRSVLCVCPTTEHSAPLLKSPTKENVWMLNRFWTKHKISNIKTISECICVGLRMRVEAFREDVWAILRFLLRCFVWWRRKHFRPFTIKRSLLFLSSRAHEKALHWRILPFTHLLLLISQKKLARSIMPKKICPDVPSFSSDLCVFLCFFLWVVSLPFSKKIYVYKCWAYLQLCDGAGQSTALAKSGRKTARERFRVSKRNSRTISDLLSSQKEAGAGRVGRRLSANYFF